MASTFSLSGLLRLVPRWVDDLTATAVTDTATIMESVALTHGAAAGQADAYWRGLLTIPANSSATIDLFALPMVAFGGSGSLALAAVKMLAVFNRSTAAAVSFNAAGANRWAGYSAGAISLPAGATLFAFDAGSGYPVGGSSRSVVIQNLSATVAASVDIYLAGVID